MPATYLAKELAEDFGVPRGKVAVLHNPVDAKALEAAANDLDTDMTDDLTAMIARTERELEVLEAKVAAAGG